MKKPKSTRNKNGGTKFDFKGASITDKLPVKKRKMTEDQEDAEPGRLTDRKPKKEDHKLNISPNTSDEDVKESSTNTFGFIPMNNLSNKKLGMTN